MERAQTQSAQKNPKLALQTLGKALALAPNSEDVLRAYAEAALAADAPVRALPSLEALARIAPSEARSRYLMGVAFSRIGDYETAVVCFRDAERIDPKNSDVLATLGTALNRRGQFEDALSVLLRASTLDPEAVPTLAARAEAEAGLREFEAAEARVQRVLARAPADGIGNYVLGLLRLRQEKYAEARAALEKAVAADPVFPAAHEKLSIACEAEKDSPCAKREADLARQRETELRAQVEEARRLAGFEREGTTP
jgi:tetratricopeptide (TPR) repeat protein